MNDNVKDSINKSKFLSHLKDNFKIILLSLIVIVAFILSVNLVKRHMEKTTEIEITEEYALYQYFNGIKYEYNGNAKLKNNKEITSIEFNNEDIEVGNIPLYYQNIDNEMIFPVNMELVFLSDKSAYYKVPYFSRIYYYNDDDNNEHTFLRNINRVDYPLRDTFLFDGENLYIFPFSTVVTVNGNEYKLSPLSYISVIYKNQIEMYDKASNTYTVIEECNDDVIAKFDNYRINLSTDMVMYNNNENRLLIRNVSNLNNYNGELN